MPTVTQVVRIQLGPEPGTGSCRGLGPFSLLFTGNNSKHSDRRWVIIAPTVPNGCGPRVND